MTSSRILHAAQRGRMGSLESDLWQTVEQVPWVGLREPLPVPDVIEDNSEAAWLEYSGPDELLWRIAT